MSILNTVITGDCLVESDKIPSGSVDLILTDLPYGTMIGQSSSGIYHKGKEQHAWDLAIEPKKVYEIASRILRKNGKMILFSQEPYTNLLMNEAIPNVPFSYRAVWLKDTLGSFMRSNKALLYRTEDILLFSKSHQKHDFEGTHPLREYSRKLFNYMGIRKQDIKNRLGHQKWVHFFQFNGVDNIQFGLCTEQTYNELIQVFKINEIDGFIEYHELKRIDTEYRQDLIKRMNEECPSTFNLWQGGKYKDNIFEYKRERNGYHPTQKPVLLLEDLIKTFSNEGDTVVDLTAGSGSTAVAAINTGRNFVAIEKDEQYAAIAQRRIDEALAVKSHD